MDFLHVRGGGHLIECNYCMETVVQLGGVKVCKCLLC